MFSGKTTELMHRMRQHPPSSVRAFKHSADDRYRAGAIVTHDGHSSQAIRIDRASAMLNSCADGVTLVVVDEAHFFEDQLLEVVRTLADRGIEVVLTSLDLDSWGQPFPLIDKLCALATEVVVKTGTCARCGKPADRTQRLTPIIDGQMITGPEHYESRCQTCWTPPPETPPEYVPTGWLNDPG